VRCNCEKISCYLVTVEAYYGLKLASNVRVYDAVHEYKRMEEAFYKAVKPKWVTKNCLRVIKLAEEVEKAKGGYAPPKIMVILPYQLRQNVAARRALDMQ
jgi:hypothetical protein